MHVQDLYPGATSDQEWLHFLLQLKGLPSLFEVRTRPDHSLLRLHADVCLPGACSLRPLAVGQVCHGHQHWLSCQSRLALLGHVCCLPSEYFSAGA